MRIGAKVFWRVVRAGALLLLAVRMAWPAFAAEQALVLQTDFGLKDGAVAAMRGIAVGVSPRLAVHDLSHENTPYDIWEAAYRLSQAAPFWPAGTVFVSVIDPGVGTGRKSMVLQTKSGHFFVTPDNGTLTLVAEQLGIAAVREIDETRHRRPGSDRSYTFHGRDVYAFVGARLAAGLIGFKDVGPERPAQVVMIPYERPRLDGTALVGTVPFLDFQYGNVWTNLDEALFARIAPKFGDRFRVTLTRGGQTIFSGTMPYARTFGEVAPGAPLLYLNSLMNVAFALNQGSFARQHGIASGGEWGVRVEKVTP
jgi:S-adenosylmethionine hydrolase